MSKEDKEKMENFSASQGLETISIPRHALLRRKRRCEQKELKIFVHKNKQISDSNKVKQRLINNANVTFIYIVALIKA